MPLLIQDIIVTLVALSSGGIILQRIWRTLRDDSGSPCGNCASGTAACSTRLRHTDDGPQPIQLRTKKVELRTPVR